MRFIFALLALTANLLIPQALASSAACGCDSCPPASACAAHDGCCASVCCCAPGFCCTISQDEHPTKTVGTAERISLPQAFATLSLPQSAFDSATHKPLATASLSTVPHAQLSLLSLHSRLNI